MSSTTEATVEANTPEIKTLADLTSGSKKVHEVKLNNWHLISLTFIVSFLLLWLIMYTFQPTLFLNDDSFLKDFNTAGTAEDDSAAKDNKVLSDKGRNTIFLWSLILSLVIAVIVYFLLNRKKK